MMALPHSHLTHTPPYTHSSHTLTSPPHAHTHTHCTVDNSLVTLDNADSSPGADYINASIVKGYYLHPEFIVTQHPLDNTRESFWRMVLQRNIATIVTIGPLSDSKVCECGI